MPFAGGGEIALFADPDDNVIGLWRRKAGPAEGAAAKPAGESAAAPKPAAKPAKAPKPPAKPKKPK